MSEEVVRAMAQGAKLRSGAHCSLSVSGVAGPGGGTPEKPVGTVWLGASTPAGTAALKRRFLGDRDAVREWSATQALELLRRLLEGVDPEATVGPSSPQ